MKLAIPRGLDWYLIGCSTILFSLGISIIYSLSLVRNAPSLVTGQLIALIVGIALAIIVASYDYRRAVSLVPFLYFVGIALLVAVLFVGDTVLGAKRWISLGVLQLQPSELMKLFLVGMVANQLAGLREYKLRSVFGILCLIGLPVAIVLFQPDLGTAAVMASSMLVVLITAKLPRKYWAVLLVVFSVTLPVVFMNLQDYQRARIQAFLQPNSDPYGTGYNVLQSIIAVGNGSMWGQGIGQGTQSQLEFLPIAHTDFIFAGIAEATGFFGSSIVVVLFGVLCLRALLIAQRSADEFGFYLGIGIAALWLIQFSINIAMNIGLVPVTGIPLPFVSHGGTALVVNCVAVGLLQSIAMRSHRRLHN